MPRTRYCDKVLDRHADPKQRAKIVRAKLREEVKGRLTPAQELLINTMVPLYLELDRMASTYGEACFKMLDYVGMQNSYRASYERLIESTIRRNPLKREPETRERPKTAVRDTIQLGDILGTKTGQKAQRGRGE